MTAHSYAEILTALVGSSRVSEVMSAYPTPQDLARADIEALPMSPAKRKALACALELGQLTQQPREERHAVRGSQDVYAFYAPRLQALSHEVFHVMCLDAKHRLLRDARIVEGGLTTCSVLPREVFAAALAARAPAVIFVHNHPSGDPEPSADDLTLTARLKQAGAVLGIKSLDHIVIGEGRYHSMADEGQFFSL